MHLVGFTIEIYYDARPYERQIAPTCFGAVTPSSESALFVLVNVTLC